MAIASQMLFAWFVFACTCEGLTCAGRTAPQDSCVQGVGGDELSMLQTVPTKGSGLGTESSLVFEAEAAAEAQDLDPQAESGLVAVAVMEAEVVVDKTEILHPNRSPEPLLIRAIEFYKSSLESWPHLTNGIVAYIITTLGDASAQIIQGGAAVLSVGGFDVKRNVALALTASIYSGLILTSWLLALNQAFPGFGLRLVMGKLAATQTFLQPFVYVPFFFIVHGMFCGQTSSEIRSKIRNDYFDLLFRLWSLFMPTRFLMFLIIPVRYQVLWDSTVAFIWQFALSLMIAKKGSPQMLSGKKGYGSTVLKAKAFIPATAEGASEAAQMVSSDAGY